jgi:hypothetical protein
MPYALCPMPYARRVPHVTEKGYIAVLTKVRYALCPIPYALCPMPYARRVPHVTEKGYITTKVLTTNRH